MLVELVKRYLIILKIRLLQINAYIIIVLLSIIYALIYINNKVIVYEDIDKHEMTFKIVNLYVLDDIAYIEGKGVSYKYYVKSEEEKEAFNNKYELGDVVKVIGENSIPKNNTLPNMFNYKKYLLSKNIYYVFKVDNMELVSKNNNIFYKFKNYARKRIEVSDKDGYLNALILGNSKYIDRSVMENYRINNITHLFALSGMHVSTFAYVIEKILENINKKLRLVITFIILLFISFLASFTPSILRATILYMFIEIKKLFNIKIDNSNILLIIFSFFVIFNPYYLYNLGFILSFTISYFFLFGSKYIKIKNKVLNSLVMSMLASLCSLPIIINNFYQINIIGFINNVFFIPYMSVVYIFSLITFAFPFMYFAFDILINVMESLSSFSTSVININLSFAHLNLVYIIIYYYVFISFVKRRKKKYIILLFIMILFFYINKFYNLGMNVYYLDVGQGDSSVIRFKDKTVLIDTGGVIYDNSKYVSNTYIPFLYSVGSKKIDYLIITHGDMDHIGNAKYIIKNINVLNVIFNCGNYNKLENELIDDLLKYNIKYYSCIKKLDIGRNKLEFLNTGEYNNENDNSSVIYFNYNNYKFLFMGDAGTSRENDILVKYNLPDIYFLKVGHHGSDTSSSEKFINVTNPKYSIISVGKNNKYGHPKESVLNNLKNSYIYRTDKDGTTEIKINKKEYEIKICSP